MAAMYPISLKVEGRKCLVVGGGKVALRKAKALIECGGKVVVISPETIDEITTLSAEGKIELAERPFFF